MDKVWSIVINGKNDQIIMNDAQAMIVKMKFMPNIEMYDLTTLHNIKPEHLHKVNREEALNNDVHLSWIKNALEMNTLGGYPGNKVKENWSFEGLMQNKG
jgi:hypothetical protein